MKRTWYTVERHDGTTSYIPARTITEATMMMFDALKRGCKAYVTNFVGVRE